jgi:LysR family glycine cleavage system transcriptional activator
MQHLPPLNALRAFEAAARHQSFKEAGEELRVTPGAISRHVSNLESFLGLRLFVRRNRRVTLTRSGQAYLRQVQDGLAQIARATAALAARAGSRTLRLKLPPTFAARWLVPRLGRFHALHPRISVQITTSHDPADYENEDIDAAVQYGTALGPGLTGELLFHEMLIPICRAGLVPRCTPAELAGRALLHSLRRPDDWPRWFQHVGAAGTALQQTLVFENSTLTYQGVLDGLGVAVAQVAFVADELRSGRLECPVPVPLSGAAAYFLSYPEEHARMPRLRAFHTWIAQEAAATRREMAAEWGAPAPATPRPAGWRV